MTPDELEKLAQSLTAPSASSANIDSLVSRVTGQPEYVEGAPEDYFLDPQTGQMVSREMLVRRLRERASPARSAHIGALDGLALSGADEAMGGINAVAGAPSGAGDRYTYGREYARAASEVARAENPWAYYGAAIPGAIGSSLAGWAAAGVPAVGQTALGTLGRGMAMGGTEGAVVGALSGEGATDRGTQAVVQGGAGTMLGGAAAPLGWGVQKAGRGISDLATGAVEAMTGGSNPAKAGRAIADTVARSGQTMDDVARAVRLAASEGQPEYRLMDALGVPGQRRASGVVRSGGDGAAELASYLHRRGIDATDRMTGFVDEAYPAREVSRVAQGWAGAPPGNPVVTADDARAALTSARREASNAAYDAARAGAGPVDVRSAVSVIDDRIGGMQGVDIRGDSIDAKLAGFRNRLMARAPETAQVGSTEAVAAGTNATPTSVELSDFSRVLGVKQDVDDAIGVAVRAGRNNEARELGKLKSALDAALEGASPGYRAANDSHRAMSRVVDAVDEGARAAGGRGRWEDTTRRFSNMTPDEQVAARAGYGDRIIDDLGRRAARGPDVSRPFASTRRKAEEQVMANNPDLLRRRIDREGTMYETSRRATQGSMTADNLQDIADLTPFKSAIRAARGIVSLNPGQAMQDMMAAVEPILSGTPEGTRTLIARALMSENPEAALRAAAKANAGSAEARRAIVTTLRALGRQPVLEATR